MAPSSVTASDLPHPTFPTGRCQTRRPDESSFVRRATPSVLIDVITLPSRSATSPNGLEDPLPGMSAAHTVSLGWRGGAAQTFGLPAPQDMPGPQEPQERVLPQPSEMVPQSAPCWAQVVATHPPPPPEPASDPPPEPASEPPPPEVPQTFARPPPQRAGPEERDPPRRVRPQPPPAEPQFLPCAAQVVGVHAGPVEAMPACCVLHAMDNRQPSTAAHAIRPMGHPREA